jgi:hypothetical protein
VRRIRRGKLKSLVSLALSRDGKRRRKNGKTKFWDTGIMESWDNGKLKN